MRCAADSHFVCFRLRVLYMIDRYTQMKQTAFGVTVGTTTLRGILFHQLRFNEMMEVWLIYKRSCLEPFPDHRTVNHVHIWWHVVLGKSCSQAKRGSVLSEILRTWFLQKLADSASLFDYFYWRHFWLKKTWMVLSMPISCWWLRASLVWSSFCP